MRGQASGYSAQRVPSTEVCGLRLVRPKRAPVPPPRIPGIQGALRAPGDQGQPPVPPQGRLSSPLVTFLPSPLSPCPQGLRLQAWLPPGPFPKHAVARTGGYSPLRSRRAHPSRRWPQVRRGASDAGPHQRGVTGAKPAPRRRCQGKTACPPLPTGPAAGPTGTTTRAFGGSDPQTGTRIPTPVGSLPEQTEDASHTAHLSQHP